MGVSLTGPDDETPKYPQNFLDAGGKGRLNPDEAERKSPVFPGFYTILRMIFEGGMERVRGIEPL